MAQPPTDGRAALYTHTHEPFLPRTPFMAAEKQQELLSKNWQLGSSRRGLTAVSIGVLARSLRDAGLLRDS